MFNTNHHFFTAEYTKTKPCKCLAAPSPPSFKDGFKRYIRFNFSVTITAC